MYFNTLKQKKQTLSVVFSSVVFFFQLMKLSLSCFFTDIHWCPARIYIVEVGVSGIHGTINRTESYLHIQKTTNDHIIKSDLYPQGQDKFLSICWCDLCETPPV